MSENIERKVLEWFINGRVGSSSKAMACAVVGIGDETSYPHDPYDLNRCLLFLDQVKEARDHFDKISSISKYWKALIDNWDKIESTFLDEAGLDWCKAKRAQKTYDLMKSIIRPIENNDESVSIVRLSESISIRSKV